MSEEIIRKYEETISLLQFKNPKTSYHGEFVKDGNGKTAFKLCFYKSDDPNSFWGTSYRTRVFKYMDTPQEALKFFIKAAQNRVF